MAKDITVSVRFGVEHLAYLHEALSKSGLPGATENFSTIVRNSTIMYLMSANPNWLSHPPCASSLTDIASRIDKKKRKGTTHDEMMQVVNQLKMVTQPSIISRALDIATESTKQMLGECTTTQREKLLNLEAHRYRIIQNMVPELTEHAEKVWLTLIDPMGLTVEQQLEEDNNPKVRAITALLIEGLRPHDPSIVTPDELAMVKQILSEGIE